jgi:DNA-binding response OmpR family regulator
MPVARILSVGETKSLMVSRSMLLRHAGYAVDEAYSLREAFKVLDSDSPDAVLICHSLPAAERDTLISSIRERQQLLPIFCIDNTGVPPRIKGCQVVPNAPEELLAAIHLKLSAIRRSG